MSEIFNTICCSSDGKEIKGIGVLPYVYDKNFLKARPSRGGNIQS